jgi:hypothetical protein
MTDNKTTWAAVSMPTLELLPLPKDLSALARTDVEKLRNRMMDPAKTTWKDGALHWQFEDGTLRALSPEMQFRDAYITPPARQQAVYDAELKATLRHMRTQRRALPPDARFEMRAAFGPGVKVQNVLTGETWET